MSPVYFATVVAAVAVAPAAFAGAVHINLQYSDPQYRILVVSVGYHRLLSQLREQLGLALSVAVAVALAAGIAVSEEGLVVMVVAVAAVVVK